MNARLPSLAVLLLLTSSLSLPAADWPQWRGPDRTGVSRETGLLRKWPKDGPALLWTSEEVGIGYSTVAVVGERLYTMGADDTREFVCALDSRSGKKLWLTPFGDRFENNWGDGPRATPTIVGDRLYALGAQGDLVCLELATGKTLWQKSLARDLGGQVMSAWGYTESPLVDGDKVICTPGGARGTVAALDARSGDVLWRSRNFTEAAGYSSLVASNACGVKQYVQLTGDSVAAVAADDGRLLWRFARSSPVAAVPTPVVHDQFVYATSGYNAGAHLVKLSGDLKSIKAEEGYANKVMTNHHGGVILVKDHLYGYSDGHGWVCQELKTGAVPWSSRTIGKGSLTSADGMLYLFTEGNGTVALVEANTEKCKEISRFRLPRQTTQRKPAGAIWTHPVVATGRLYLRDQELLFCYDIKAK